MGSDQDAKPSLSKPCFLMRVKLVILRFTGNFKELDRIDLLKMNRVRGFTCSDVNFTTKP